jgi:ADP-ribose diphosphatase
MLDLVIARDLYPSKLEGDEPEPLEVVRYPLADIDELITQADFHEGRAIAALYLLKKWLSQGN